ncbi:hypothetical protein [Desulfosporosinus hippei]|uniref:Uncharacterized protein n=1 Tax=Desulfosporosinus hippei DSM 8344 TaxID=1121419 RepID=A0A1G7Z5L2_9FIRM|nr:hypothetical protein [Desulfosporosinus hippei]SDH03875.1 hypothetical protein SAMN05443529_10912 [Desulfosporosinus hippei DSM 8344]
MKIHWHDCIENEASYWEWTKDGRRIGVSYGEYFFNNKPIKVTRDEDGEIINFKYINDEN